MTVEQKARQLALTLVGEDQTPEPLIEALMEMAEWQRKQMAVGGGLLYWDGKRIYPVVAPVPMMQGCHADMRILYILMFREGMTGRTYDYRGRPSTIQPQRLTEYP